MKTASTVVATVTYHNSERKQKKYTDTVLVLENETYPNDIAYNLTIFYNIYGMTVTTLPGMNEVFRKLGLPELNDYDFGDGDETEEVSAKFSVGNTTLFSVEEVFKIYDMG